MFDEPKQPWNLPRDPQYPVPLPESSAKESSGRLADVQNKNVAKHGYGRIYTRALKKQAVWQGNNWCLMNYSEERRDCAEISF